MRRRILAETPPTQPLSLEFSDAGIDIDAQGVGRFHRDWREAARVFDFSGGVLMTFDDDAAHWLPARVFRSPAERRAFVDYARVMIPVDSDE